MATTGDILPPPLGENGTRSLLHFCSRGLFPTYVCTRCPHYYVVPKFVLRMGMTQRWLLWRLLFFSFRWDLEVSLEALTGPPPKRMMTHKTRRGVITWGTYIWAMGSMRLRPPGQGCKKARRSLPPGSSSIWVVVRRGVCTTVVWWFTK